MDNEIMIFNQTNEDIPELDLVKKVLEFGMKKEKLNHTSFNVIIVDNNYIHELNKNYRDIDRETDVITFALEDEDSVKLPGDMRILGDIYISIDKARSQAIEYGHSFERELAYMMVHGFYHLMGEDHIEEADKVVMRQKEENVLTKLGITRD